jgi:uncharacterized protein (DUF983 family)
MWRCPRCKSEIRIFEASTTVLVYEDGCEQDDGFEWDDDNKASASLAIGRAPPVRPKKTTKARPDL